MAIALGMVVAPRTDLLGVYATADALKQIKVAFPAIQVLSTSFPPFSSRIRRHIETRCRGRAGLMYRRVSRRSGRSSSLRAVPIPACFRADVRGVLPPVDHAGVPVGDSASASLLPQQGSCNLVTKTAYK